MIQLRRDDTTYINTQYLAVQDVITNTDYGLLATLTSQLTGKSKTFICNTNYSSTRIASILLFVLASSSGENLTSGVIFLGSTDYPLGFYDITFYQNTSASNLDPTGLTVVSTQLANLSATSDVQPVTYSEYTTNDSDTESVYITF
tara:strand:- start:674 stop:1111 length:438 start_codon:yes stop_codon:yes gene_type:complete